MAWPKRPRDGDAPHLHEANGEEMRPVEIEAGDRVPGADPVEAGPAEAETDAGSGGAVTDDLLLEVNALAQHLRDLQSRIATYSVPSRPAETEQHPSTVEGSTASHHAREAAKYVEVIIAAAEKTAAEIREKSEAEAATLREQARLDAARIREEVELPARQLKDEAEASATRLRKEAEAHAMRFRQEAEAHAARMRAEAEADAVRMRAEAEADAMRMREEAESEAARVREEGRADEQRVLEAMESLRPATLELQRALERMMDTISSVLAGTGSSA